MEPTLETVLSNFFKKHENEFLESKTPMPSYVKITFEETHEIDEYPDFDKVEFFDEEMNLLNIFLKLNDEYGNSSSLDSMVIEAAEYNFAVWDLIERDKEMIKIEKTEEFK